MKQLATLLTVLMLGGANLAQAQVGINTTTPDNSAVLDLSSTARGILIPRMSATERASISAPATGLLVYQHTAPAGFYYYSGSGWTYLDPAPAGDNLGNHTATQAVKLNGNTLSNNGMGGLQFDNAGMAAFGTTPGANIPLTVLAPASSATSRTVVAQHLNLGLGAEFAGLNDNGARVGFGINNSGHPEAGTAYIWNYANGAFRIGTNGAERLRILAGGNVGIGTSTPTQKLEVAGQVYSSAGGFRFPDNTVQTTAAAADNLGNHTATQNLNLNSNWVSNDGSSLGLKLDNDGNAQLKSAATGAVAGLDVLKAGGSGNGVQALLSGSATGTAGYFSNTNAANSSDALVGTSSGSGYGGAFFGSALVVGKGTTNSTRAFQVDNSARNSLFRIFDNGSAALTAFTPLAYGGYSSVGTLANKRGLTIATGNSYTPDAPAVLELVGSAANVGEELGMIDFIHQSSNSNTYNVARITAVRENSNPTFTALAFYTRQFAALGEKMRLTNAGRLGIGTNAPNTPLEVSGTGNQAIRIATTDNTDAMLDLVISGSTYNDYQIRNDNGLLRLSSSTSDLFTTAFRVNMDEPGNWYPNGNGTQSLGLSTNRWAAVYAANGTIQTSDRRLKDNIRPLGYGLQEVLKMQPVSYTWKSNGEKKVGLIAQDVKKLVPEVVNGEESASTYLGMNYAELVPVLIKALQEQQELIKAQQSSNAQLQQQVNGQAAQLERISRSLEKLESAQPGQAGYVKQ